MGLLFSLLPPGERLDGLFFDRAALLWAGPRPAPQIMAVLIGEKDYQEAAIPLALWGGRLAPLLDHLSAGSPRAVGLDLLLPQFPLGRVMPGHDQKLMRSLAKASAKTRLVSGYGITPAGFLQEPFAVYQRILGPKGYGFFNLTPDPDGICRVQTLALAAGPERVLQSFAALVAGLRAEPGSRLFLDWRNPCQISTMSMQKALTADPGLFRDKIVLVGMDFSLQDKYPTPAGPAGESGVLFQARVVQSLLSGRHLVDPGWLLSRLVPAFLAVLVCWIVSRRATPFKVTLAGLAGAAAGLALCLAGLAAGVVLFPSTALASLIPVSAFRLGRGFVFVKENFGRYVSREVRDEILSGRISLDGEMKEVSVLFADLRGFTPLTASHHPKQVLALINAYFEAMSRAIRQNGGLVLQYVGDEIYAIFGAPLGAGDHALRAVKSASAMREALKKLNRDHTAKGLPALRHGIGVHCGRAVAGNVGGGDRVSYALVGDVVNTGSRIQGLNKEFGTEVLVSGEVRRLAGDAAFFRKLPPAMVKGKDKPLEIWELL